MGNYGTINSGSLELKIIDFTTLQLKGKSIITIAETDNKSYVLIEENLINMKKKSFILNESSMASLVFAFMAHIDLKNVDFNDFLDSNLTDVKFNTTIDSKNRKL